MEIKVVVKSVYGKRMIYPVDHLEILDLTGTRTLDHRHIEALKKLGYVITVVVEEPVKL